MFEILFLFQQTSPWSCAVYYFYFGPFAQFKKSHVNVGHPAPQNQLKLSVTILSYVFQNNEKTSCRKKRQDIREGGLMSTVRATFGLQCITR